jgi:hypothetical protein
MEISMYGGRTSSVVQKAKKLTDKEQTHTQKTLGVIKRDRWHNLMEISMYGRTDFVRRTELKKADNKETTQKHRKTLG